MNTDNQRFNFIGCESGDWRVPAMKTVVGAALAEVEFIRIIEGEIKSRAEQLWILSGVRSYARYTNRAEKDLLESRQPELNRPDAKFAALIPIRKTAQWWNLAQDERREILAKQSKHLEIGFNYLPAIARRLYHSRDLSGEEFDFLTWFEYAANDAEKFDELLDSMRQTEEWKYVEREVDIRLVRV